ncbi:MAG: glycosyltransferase family 2 protein [Candidatus Omnitrophica bacterium]|nr:glycosyltransferase family 2 protein [Candidatus Omnitrophota bacterium]
MPESFKISIVLPAFNEETNIRVMVDQLTNQLAGFDYEIIFVDDGSQDGTLQILKQLCTENSKVHFLSFSRNFGHQNALKAGLDHACGDCVIFMDCDLQHPPELLLKMVHLWQSGNEVVYTIRQDGRNTPLLKRTTAALFYRFLNLLSDVPITHGRADFFLIDRIVADVLKNYDESPLFYRGMLSWVGFKQVAVKYEAHQRFSGKTKYSFKKMFEFAVDGITSFSIKPLRVSIFCGSFLSAGAFIYLMFIIYQKVFTNHTISGWSSILASVLLLGGIQLIVLGIMGEYLGKLFMNAKRRPNYIIRDKSL